MNGQTRLLLELIGAAIIAGAALFYANEWRAEAEEAKSQLLGEDKLLMDLYRKVEQLEKRNTELLDEVRRLETESQLQSDLQ
ncbi:MAG: hypothetical protein AAF585_14350 [Verrucomicrobiota bacterium]